MQVGRPAGDDPVEGRGSLEPDGHSGKILIQSEVGTSGILCW